jgi:2-polyprenyl-6-methoxyphenol hydroxylase-like FAD-dependent oxidoreductase
MKIDPVLICGAGPTGLCLAIFLKAHEIPFRIIDKNESIVELSKALAIQPRTLEIFERLGFIDPFLKFGRRLSAMTMYVDGKPTVSATYDKVDSKYTYPLLVAQNVTESLLTKELKKRKVSIERQKELISFQDNGDHITADIKDKKGNISSERFSYIVGCDGAHSTVRSTLNIPFEGTDYAETFALADLKMQCLLNPSELHIFPSSCGVMGILPFLEEDKFRIVVSLPPSDLKNKAPTNAGQGNTQNTFTDTTLTAKQLTTYVKERGLEQFTIKETEWLSNFRIHRRIAKKWILGRSILCGDAAHIHSPMGGQGMNTGIQDAWNLAWKLSYHLKYGAPKEWLDTYETERLYTGKKVLRISNIITRMALLSSSWLKSVRRFVLSHFGNSFLAPKAVKNMSQIYFKYPKTALCERDFFPVDGLEVGMNVFNRPLSSGTLFDYLDSTRFTLLIFAKASRSAIEKSLELKKQVASDLINCEVLASAPYHSGGTILDGSGKCHKLFGASTEKMVLVRPDRYIAWQCEGIDRGPLMRFLNSSGLDKCLQSKGA